MGGCCKHYTAEEDAYLCELVPTCHSWQEVHDGLLARFGNDRTTTGLYVHCRGLGVAIAEGEISPHNTGTRRAHVEARLAVCQEIAARVYRWRDFELAYNASGAPAASIKTLRSFCARHGVKLQPMPPTARHKGSRQLCESCANAVPNRCGRGCSWSRRLQPVEGWTTKKGGPDFYIVACPEYAQEVAR